MNYESMINEVIKENRDIVGGSSMVSLWSKWYKGFVPAFHNYDIYNGTDHVRVRRLSAQGAKRVCEDWASLLMNEKVEIITKDKEKFDAELERMNFWIKANKAVEYGFGTSLAAIVIDLKVEAEEVYNPETKENDLVMKSVQQIDLSVHSANRIVPMTIRNDEIVECAFLNVGTNETTLAIHKLNDKGNYDIVIAVVESKTKKTKSVMKIPLDVPFMTFALIHPNIVNNLEIDSPLPIAVFANAIDTLKALDVKVDSYHNEFILGRKRIFVSHELTKVNMETGQVEQYFDPKDTLYYRLPHDDNAKDGKGEPLIKIEDTTLRATEHQIAIQDDWNQLSLKCGLGIERYKFEKGRVMTATQVISEKSDVAQTIRRHEILLRHRILTLVRSMIYLFNAFTDKKFSDELVDIKFEDGIIEDTETQKNSDRVDVDKGVMSRVEYRVKWYGEDEATAMEKTNRYFGNIELATRINAFLPAFVQGVMTAKQFVDNVYLDETNKEELAKELESKLNASGTISPDDVTGAGFYNPSK